MKKLLLAAACLITCLLAYPAAAAATLAPCSQSTFITHAWQWVRYGSTITCDRSWTVTIALQRYAGGWQSIAWCSQSGFGNGQVSCAYTATVDGTYRAVYVSGSSW